MLACVKCIVGCATALGFLPPYYACKCSDCVWRNAHCRDTAMPCPVRARGSMWPRTRCCAKPTGHGIAVSLQGLFSTLILNTYIPYYTLTNVHHAATLQATS